MELANISFLIWLFPAFLVFTFASAFSFAYDGCGFALEITSAITRFGASIAFGNAFISVWV